MATQIASCGLPVAKHLLRFKCRMAPGCVIKPVTNLTNEGWSRSLELRSRFVREEGRVSSLSAAIPDTSSPPVMR